MRYILIAFICATLGFLLIWFSYGMPWLDWNVRVLSTVNRWATYRIELGELPWATRPYESLQDWSIIDRLRIYADTIRCRYGEAIVTVQVDPLLDKLPYQLFVWSSRIALVASLGTGLFLVWAIIRNFRSNPRKIGALAIFAVIYAVVVLGIAVLANNLTTPQVSIIPGAVSPTLECQGSVILAADFHQVRPEGSFLFLMGAGLELSAFGFLGWYWYSSRSRTTGNDAL